MREHVPTRMRLQSDTEVLLFTNCSQCCSFMQLQKIDTAMNREVMERCIVTGGNQGKRPFPAGRSAFSTANRRGTTFPNSHAPFTCAGMGLDFAKHLASRGW